VRQRAQREGHGRRRRRQRAEGDGGERLRNGARELGVGPDAKDAEQRAHRVVARRAAAIDDNRLEQAPRNGGVARDGLHVRVDGERARGVGAREALGLLGRERPDNDGQLVEAPAKDGGVRARGGGVRGLGGAPRGEAPRGGEAPALDGAMAAARFASLA